MMPAPSKIEQALAHYQKREFEAAGRILSTIPGITRTPAGCQLLGGILLELKRHDEAIKCLDEAIRLDPGPAPAWFNRGNALREIGRLPEALASFEAAIKRDPNVAAQWSNAGRILHEEARLDEAVAHFDRALALVPGNGDVLVNRALSRLLLGDYTGGLADYEARYHADQSRVVMPDDFECPVWQGEDLTGKTIIAHAEQGLGDAIQFVRLAPLLRARGARVVLGTPGKLVRLFQPFAAELDIRAQSLPGERFDYSVPLMSLPHRLGLTPANIPQGGPYLAAEPGIAAQWRARIGAQGFRVGIVWQGNPRGVIDQGRSLPLAMLAPLADIPDIRLISLQKAHGLDQLKTLPAGMTVETLGEDFDSGPDAFIDTAAVMAGLDLVVTTDTSTAHLAGALGVPTLAMLKFVPDWRWGISGETTPWYPSLTLVRQPARGDWVGAVARLVDHVARRRETVVISAS